MEFTDNILTIENQTPEVLEEHTMSGYFKGQPSWLNYCGMRFEEISDNECPFSDFVYKIVVDTEAEKIKATLRAMKLRMLKPIGSIKELRRLLFSAISLLFGLCSSRSSTILRAFTATPFPAFHLYK